MIAADGAADQSLLGVAATHRASERETQRVLDPVS